MKRLIAKMRFDPDKYGWLAFLIIIALGAYLGEINFHLKHMNGFLLLGTLFCFLLIEVLIIWYRKGER